MIKAVPSDRRGPLLVIVKADALNKDHIVRAQEESTTIMTNRKQRTVIMGLEQNKETFPKWIIEL